MGRTHSPVYQIVAAEAKYPRDGRFIEKVGFYNPFDEFGGVKVDHDAALKWLKNGAQPTDTVNSILSKEGVLLKFHLFKQGKSAEEITQAFEAWSQTKAGKKQQAVDAHQKLLNDKKNERLAHEKKVRQNRTDKILAKRTEGAKPANAPAEE